MALPLALPRLLSSGALGALTLLLPLPWPPEARALLGWNIFCALTLLRLWPLLHFVPAQVRALATREDETRGVAAFIIVAASLVSLLGVFLLLHRAQAVTGDLRLWLTLLAALTVTLSWLLVQFEYMLHYAHRFYKDGAGIIFLQAGTDDPLTDPAYTDFFYLSLTIGMTYQVSDTNLNTRPMRQLLLGHAALSYFFSVVIIAVMVSGVAGLLGS